jgi:hypothetical protein
MRLACAVVSADTARATCSDIYLHHGICLLFACLIETGVDVMRHPVYMHSWIAHNASFGFLGLAPSILHSNWFWDYIS